jgi:hypothetical protein
MASTRKWHRDAAHFILWVSSQMHVGQSVWFDERTATSGQLESYFSTVASCPDHKRTYHQHCSANKDELQQYAFAAAQGRRAVRQIHYHAQDAHTMRTPMMLEP